MDKNLNKELRKLMDDAQKLISESYSVKSLLDMGQEEALKTLAAIEYFYRAMEFYCDVFEEQLRLMNKMNKVMDKYLEA